jgi:CBS domain containing-hemolysin-like protein
MQFYKYKTKSRRDDISVSLLTVHNKKTQQALWITKISLVAFLVSLILSVFSEIFLSRSSVFFALLLLVIFMLLNIFSDMLGLAVATCQVIQIRQAKFKRKVSAMCLLLIKNSDKVSSILCDVIGDACGILCGVSGSVVAIILTSKLSISGVVIGALVSSTVVGITVLIKAIVKNYAVNNSIKIVKEMASVILKIKKIFRRKVKKK